jgi:DeoR/GlpR family transcriptional regulator of sugar metabolism
MNRSAAVGSTRMRYESAPSRRTQILNLVREAGFCSAAELSRKLSVSEMTVRRDIRRLADDGLARAVHGGISTVTALLGPVDFQFRASQRLAQKRAIARRALDLLEPGSVVALDAGTTTLEVARQLPPDFRATLVTHSLPVIAALAARSSLELIGLGGALHIETQAFAGPLTLGALGDLRVHTLLLGATSVRDSAMWCTNTFDSATKRALIRAADRVVLLVDSSKFSVTAMMKVAELSEIDTLITDDAIDPKQRALCEPAGIELITVPFGDE